MITFGEIKRLDLRTIWPHEALNFTPWLAENVRELGKALGLELEVVQQEANVGSFSLDLLVKDLGTGHTVIIENQFGPTDHDHLGKLLTYAAGYSATTIIWIAEVIREEHRSALEWLNQHTDTDTLFFGVVIEVFRIDDSKPAFNFKPVVYPNEWQRATRPNTENKISIRAEAYRNFFQTLIDELRDKHRFTGARLGQAQNWYSFASGISGITYGVAFAQGERFRVELYIDTIDTEKNKALFDKLLDDKKTIEEEMDEIIEWQRLDDRRASRIYVWRSGSIDSGDETLYEMHTWAIDRLLKFKRIFSPHLRLYKGIATYVK